MKRFVIKKALLIIPSLLILSIVVFLLSKIAPGDPVGNLIELRGQTTASLNTSMHSDNYQEVATELGLDKPNFYFGIHPASYPDTFYRIIHPQRKMIYSKWIEQIHNWDKIQSFNQCLAGFEETLLNTTDSIELTAAFKQIASELRNVSTDPDIYTGFGHIASISKILDSVSFFQNALLQDQLQKLNQSVDDIKSVEIQYKTAIPMLAFYGLDNQYHNWIKKVLRFDFGISMVDAETVYNKISYALFWTFLYVITAYILSLFIAIPLGLVSAWWYKKWTEKLISGFSFGFYAFPLFWLATLSVVFLTNNIYSDWLNIFPSVGVGRISNQMSLFEKITTAMPHLILPALILAIHSAAQGIRIIRNSAIVELKSDYFITAKAKGLSNVKLLWRHIFPNAMLPVITMLISSFPAALAGSVVLEVIFNIPGLGRLLYDSIHFMDWNVVFAILLFIGLVTFIFYLLGDILYAYLNPKIKLEA